MIDKKIFTDIAEKLSQALPSDLKAVKEGVQKNFRDILQAQFAKLDLVTREEFDVQTKVLARTREKLEQLEKHVKKLEEK
jgi:BMFP domain-containing protein YqiC